MVYFVTGGSGSGKSAYAEDILSSLQTKHKVYIATMHAKDAEAKQKVLRHKKLRANKNFHTLEVPKNIHTIDVTKEESVLLECLSNLVANEMFDCDGAKKNCIPHIEMGIDHIIQQANDVIVVGNEVFSDIKIKDVYTNAYQKALAKVTRYIIEQSDIVIELVYGIPVVWKGQINETTKTIGL